MARSSRCLMEHWPAKEDTSHWNAHFKQWGTFSAGSRGRRSQAFKQQKAANTPRCGSYADPADTGRQEAVQTGTDPSRYTCRSEAWVLMPETIHTSLKDGEISVRQWDRMEQVNEENLKAAPAQDKVLEDVPGLKPQGAWVLLVLVAR